MTRREIVRLAGTILVTIVTAMPLGAGIWSLWTVLLNRLPTAIGLLALVGILVAPVQLIRDILDIDRSGRAPEEEGEAKIETVD